MIKNFDYHCPYCTEKLKKSGEVVLKTVRNDGSEGIIKMATSIGDYGYVHEPQTDFDAGETVDFHCPYCDKVLNSPRILRHVRMSDPSRSDPIIIWI